MKRKLHALVKVVLLDDDGEPLTFSPMGYASVDRNLWIGACAVRIAEHRVIIRMGDGSIEFMRLDKVHDDSYVVSNHALKE